LHFLEDHYPTIGVASYYMMGSLAGNDNVAIHHALLHSSPRLISI